MSENKLPLDEAALKAATAALAVSDMSTRDPWELPEHRAKKMAYVQEHSDEWRDDAEACVRAYLEAIQQSKDSEPIPMALFCPQCRTQHIDEGEWATRPHRTHQCQICGREWRPANVSTVGVSWSEVYADRVRREQTQQALPSTES